MSIDTTVLLFPFGSTQMGRPLMALFTLDQ